MCGISPKDTFKMVSSGKLFQIINLLLPHKDPNS